MHAEHADGSPWFTGRGTTRLIAGRGLRSHAPPDHSACRYLRASVYMCLQLRLKSSFAMPLTDGCGSVDRPAMQQMRKAFPALESDQGQAVRTSVQRRTGDRLSATRMLLRARTRGTIAGSVTAGCRHRARQGVGDVRVNDAVRCVGRQHRARLATDLRRPRGCTGRRRLAPSTAGLRPGHLAIALALAKSDVQMAKCS
jgi:hypothetical protein